MKKEFEPVKGGCEGCPLKGKTVVPPNGRLKDCKLVVIGQAPGGNEIEEGKPFVGRAGKKLWDELKALGIERKDCYVTNIAKCRPDRTADGGGDQPPNAAVIKHCAKQFEREWARIHHKKLLMLGNVASKKITGRAMSSVRGRILDDLPNDNSGVVAWHPSFICRNVDSNFVIIWRRELALLNSLLNKPKDRPTVPYTVVTSHRDLKECVDYLGRTKEAISIDIETVGRMPSGPNAEVLTIAFSDGIRTYVWDMRELPDNSATRQTLKNILESDSPKIAQNAKFEYVWFRYKYGAIMKNIWFDPGMARYLMDKGTGTSVSLKQMVWRYFPEYGGYEAGIDYENMADTPKEKLYEYNAYDAYLTKKLSDLLKPQLEEAGFDFVYREVLIPAIYAIGEMEAVGLRLDTERIVERIEELQKEVKKKERVLLRRPAVRKVEDFKISSTHKLRQLFFKVLKKPIQHTTATGQESLTQYELGTWANEGVEEAELILDYRKAYKLLRTYFQNYLEMSTPEGFLHPSYNMVVAKGGRLTSSSPNIQNVPNEVREVFISRFEGGELLQMDFKQIEMRVMAIVANDKGLIEIFKSGGDPHRLTAAEIMEVKPESVSDDDRRHMKAVNFGLLYGMQVKTLAEREGMSLQKAEMFYNGFFRKHADVKRWQARQKQRVLRGEEIDSLFGRVRDLSIYPPEEKVNRAYNFPIQSCASDINLYFISVVWQMMRYLKMESVLIATVHDSLLIDCHPEEVNTVKDILSTVIDSLPEFFEWMTVPMAIDVATGPNWKEAK